MTSTWRSGVNGGEIAQQLPYGVSWRTLRYTVTLYRHLLPLLFISVVTLAATKALSGVAAYGRQRSAHQRGNGVLSGIVISAAYQRWRA